MVQKISVVGLSDDNNRLVNALLEQLNEKLTRNVLRSSYYDAKRAIRAMSPVVPPMYNQLGIVLGWSAKAVDILARRCNLDDFVWPDGNLDDLGYGEFAEANNLVSEVSGAITSSLQFASCFLINTTGGPGEPASLLHVKDATSATGTWNGRTRRLDNLLSVVERDDQGEVSALVLYLNGETVTMRNDGGRWRVVDIAVHDMGVPVELMAYKPRPDRPFGSSRISRPVMSLHDQAVRTVIRMEGHADVFSFPEMWMLGADERIFKNADGTVKANWQVMLGRIKGIPDDDSADNPRADVKQFQASSPEPHIAQLRQQAMLFSGETSIPLTSLGVSDQSNPTSADSYIASREDLIAEAEGATDDWSMPLRRAVIRGLAIQNGGASSLSASMRSIQPKWRNPLYLSKAAQADAGSKQLGAVPWLQETEVGLELLGLTDQQITRALADRRKMNGSAALRAITEAAQAGITPNGSLAMDPAEIKAKADAMGVLIRAGVSPESAARQVGMTGVQFTGAVPTSLRVPQADAVSLEA